MAMYPERLMPEAVEDLHLPYGPNVRVPKARSLFRLWSGGFEEDTYCNRALTAIEGRPKFAELAVLTLLQKDDWARTRLRQHETNALRGLMHRQGVVATW